ncbi:SusC/RagA family TonB-linked outer membrane protein [Pedobacter sp. MC2016-14]|uniref:SusC/RagA family TonB-linked outer membrane protein n=1 Tax=Pedobacter sp. MC2016-14 TaxID=2897327 RepID=UPI001E5DB53B|nr:SusC/RagA family TonB-linked outer membrane protein [Pedobacter sp. MC2016-14]MCD0487392.1 SusC/RagA family TonB-linked outer membrane protein [Pedobacter sp. MC2016-14]
MKKLILSLFVFLCFAGAALAQERTVTGTVTDTDGGLPLPGVSVRVIGAQGGTITSVDGRYSIKVPSGGTGLQFSFIGYVSQTLTLGTSSVVNVVLATDSKSLGEVVVTAMGIRREAKSLGYTVTKVSGEEITKARETNVVNALTGKVAGVRVSAQSGTLGGSSKIVIRGGSSFNDSGQPLFVVDGLPVNNGSPQISTTSGAVPQGSAGADFGNRAADINSDDIESMVVLKGAAATALYGARAKNGAIVITTKRGAKGQSSISFNSSARFDNILKLPDLQNEYAQGTQGLYNTETLNAWGPKLTEVQGRTFPDFLGNQVPLVAHPDNAKNFFRTGQTFINAISFDGADEKSDYRLGYTSTIQTGIVDKQKLNKNALSFNSGRKLSDKFEARASINYVRTKGEGMPTQSSNDPNVLIGTNYIPTNFDIEQLRDNYYDDVLKAQIPITTSRNGNNPFWIINNNTSTSVVDRVFGNGILTYKPISWLTISDNIGTDFYNESRFIPTRIGTIGALTGNFLSANLYNRVINNDLIVTADRKLSDDLDLKIIAGHNIYETYSRSDQAYAQNLTVDQLYNFSNAASIINQNTSAKRRIVGVYGDIGLSYRDYLFLNVTGRNDYSSTLSKENNSYFYPSVSSGFVFSELLPKNDWLSYGKLRASWANVGSDSDPYLLAFVYSGQSTAFAQYGFGSSFPFNGVLAYSIPSIIPNPNLKPQNQNSLEFGTELKFLKNRISLDVTYYNSNTTDQIVNLALPQSTGFASKTVNAGSIRNSGIEVALGLVPVQSRDFRWNLDVNFAKNKQVVTLPEDVASYSIASGWSGLQVKVESGKAFGIYGSAWERDPNGNIVIDANTGLRKTIVDQRLGNTAPDWTMGINNTLSYKNFNLSFLVDIKEGGIMFSNTVATLRSTGLAEETLANRGNIFIDKGVIKQGNNYVTNTVPVQSMEDYWGQYTSTNTESSIFNSSFIKLREVNLSYRIPAGFLQKRLKFIKGLEAGLEGRNLWLIKSYVPHIDPESNLFGTSSNGDGVEFNNFPATRTIGFNLRVKI